MSLPHGGATTAPAATPAGASHHAPGKPRPERGGSAPAGREVRRDAPDLARFAVAPAAAAKAMMSGERSLAGALAPTLPH
jgi:hypothetical protein